jgi:polyisoprenoid-binding protein YceI
MTRPNLLLSTALALLVATLVHSPHPLVAQRPGLGADAAAGERPGGDMQESWRYVVAEQGNEARYRVREQLLGFDFPNDAVGVTGRITGVVMVDGEGGLADGSHIVVDLSALTSDSDRRDNFIRRRTLNTETHPEAVFVPRRVRGLAGPLPPSGEVSFRIEGDMTVREATRAVVWEVVARRAGEAVVGTATTRFPFSHFDLEIPRVRSVLSVDDDIRLEYDFRFVPADGPGSDS